ncbi:EAL domain-containing protein [Yoonia sediminilitoris]|uniref:EAL domain-containing protein n=1 Tax=Yoonia sediminilitoris TaxID=1286148 RepID=UPI000D387D65
MQKLARTNGFLLLAEGVETESNVACLQKAGVDLVQGYALHRPMSPVDLMQLPVGQARSAPERASATPSFANRATGSS